MDGQAAVGYLLKDMNYGNLPKGLLLFHSYEEGARTPALEHLVEGAMYASSKGEVNIHFTVSHEHLPLFQAHIADNLAAYEEKLGVKFHVSYSEQKLLPTRWQLTQTVPHSVLRMVNCFSDQVDMAH